jgi:hypothetical protein
MRSLLFIIPLLSNTFAYVVQGQPIRGITRLETATRDHEIFTNTNSTVMTLEQRALHNFKRGQGEDIETEYAVQRPNVKPPDLQQQYDTLSEQIDNLLGQIGIADANLQQVRDTVDMYVQLPDYVHGGPSTRGIREPLRSAQEDETQRILERTELLRQLNLRKESLKELKNQTPETMALLRDKIQDLVDKLEEFSQGTYASDSEYSIHRRFDWHNNVASFNRVVYKTTGGTQEDQRDDEFIESLESSPRDAFQEQKLVAAKRKLARRLARRAKSLSRVKEHHEALLRLRDEAPKDSELQKKIQDAIDEGEQFFRDIDHDGEVGSTTKGPM